MSGRLLNPSENFSNLVLSARRSDVGRWGARNAEQTGYNNMKSKTLRTYFSGGNLS
jgi:hypothetical protein